MKYKAHASKAGDNAIIITGGPEPLVIHTAQTLADNIMHKAMLNAIFKDLQSEGPTEEQLKAQEEFREMLKGYIGSHVPVDARKLAVAVGFPNFDPDLDHHEYMRLKLKDTFVSYHLAEELQKRKLGYMSVSNGGETWVWDEEKLKAMPFGELKELLEFVKEYKG